MPVNWAISHLRARAMTRSLRTRRAAAAELLPVIYVPGILGVKLYDRRHGVYIWGDYRNILFRDPSHAGFSLDEEGSESETIAAEPLHAFTIIPGLLHSLVTAEVKDVLEFALGYREGRDLVFLSYDWRCDYRVLARALEDEIRRIRAKFGRQQRVIVLGQSVANLAVRYLVRHGPDDLRGSIAKWYAFGPPWRGTYNALVMLRDGYYPATRLFHGFSPADAASYPACHQLLPHDARLLTAEGQEISDFDVYRADAWVTYGLGPRELVDDRDMRRRLQALLERARAGRVFVEGQDDRDHSVVQTWFAGESNHAVVAAVAHPDGALVSERDIRSHAPRLAPRILARGDDHIPLAHLTEQPCGPLVVSHDSIPHGESYVLIGQPKDHRGIINLPANLRALATDIAEVNART